MAWGRHLIVDLSGCARALLESELTARQWIALTLEQTGMRTFGGWHPLHDWGSPHDPVRYAWGAEGVLYGPSMTIHIETSHISAHFCPPTGEAYIDLFTCGELDHESVAGMTAEHFHATACDALLIPRQAGQRPCVQTWTMTEPRL